MVFATMSLLPYSYYLLLPEIQNHGKWADPKWLFYIVVILFHVHDCGMRSIPSLTSIIFECQLPVHLNLLIFCCLLGLMTSHLSIGRCVEPPSGRLFFEPELWRASTSKKRRHGVWTLLKHLPLKNTLRETNISVENGPFDDVMIFGYHVTIEIQYARPIGSSMINSPRIWCKSKAANT